MTPIQRAWLAFSLSPKLPNDRLQALLQRFESPAQALEAGPSVWRDAGLLPETMEALSRVAQGNDHGSEAWLRQHASNHLLTPDDEDWPPALTRLDDAPRVLFVRGDPMVLWQPQIAMVGSRNPTAGGLETARDFAATLARSGLVVTSGLAAGIDGASHQGALEAGGKTVAVMGTGLDEVYPARHRKLAHSISENGALVSEYPPNTPPRSGQFPQRNRIISGLSLAVLVVEAAYRSGSLITARLASEQGRDVLAIPGSIHNPMARGCHRLIRQGAKLVETADEVVEELAPLAADLGAQIRQRLEREDGAQDAVQGGHENADGGVISKGKLTPDQRLVLEATGYDPVTIDAITERCELTCAEVSSILLTLELAGLVAPAPGSRYCRTKQGG